MHYKVGSTGIVLDQQGLSGVAEFILSQDYRHPVLPHAMDLSKKQFARMKDTAFKLLDWLQGVGEGAKTLPREIRRKIDRCLVAVARLVTGRTQIDVVSDMLEQFCARPLEA